jgi:hypothetical protein
MNYRIYLASALLALLANGRAAGADSVAPCAGVPDAKSKSRQFFDGKALMVSLSSLEAQGEAKFHPTFAPPASQCLFEKFDAGASPVEAIYSPFEQGEHTLHWRFTTAAPEPREIVVIYDAMASLIAKKDVFFVVEGRKGNISYYAIYRDQPTYAALKPVVTSILDGSAQPLATVRWPTGAKEPVIDAYDSKRLK